MSRWQRAWERKGITIMDLETGIFIIWCELVILDLIRIVRVYRAYKEFTKSNLK